MNTQSEIFTGIINDASARRASKELAAVFRWTARYNWHEAVANHFSVAVSEDGRKFLMNPDCVHFSRIRASDLLLLDTDDSNVLNRYNAPDLSAWSLHSGLHRNLPWARCALHVHSKYATVLATLENPILPPIDQNTAMFFNRVMVDTGFNGLVLGNEGERVAKLLTDPSKRTLIMGNHGVLVVGCTISEAWNRLYYFERAAETYVLALQTGRPLKILADDIAERTAVEMNGEAEYTGVADKHLTELMAILDAEGSNYAE